MVHTPTAPALVAARHQFGSGLARAGTERVPSRERTYDVEALRPDGSVTRRRLGAPATPAFEAAFSAVARGTLIATTKGQVAVEDLTPGMKLLTNERGPSPLMWIGAMTLPPRPAGRDEDTRLIRVMADAFGIGRPMPDFLTGPGARILKRNGAQADMVLTPFLDLVDGNGVIAINPPSSVRLFHLGLRRHATITAAGLTIETFHPGPAFERQMTADMLERFMSFFPHLARPSEFGPLAHPRQPLGSAGGQSDVA